MQMFVNNYKQIIWLAVEYYIVYNKITTFISNNLTFYVQYCAKVLDTL